MTTASGGGSGWRRERLSLPYSDQIAHLARLLDEHPGPDGVDQAQPAQARLVDAALHHRLAAYLLRAVQVGRLQVAATDRHRLDGSLSGAMLYGAILRHELGRISEVLVEACGRRPLAFKGPVLGELFYPDRRLRPYFDLDLLVSLADLDRAAGALEAEGYERLEEFRPGYAERFGHDVHLRTNVAGHRIDVELHWRVGDDPLGVGLSYERLRVNAELVEIDGATIAIPSAEAHLLILAVHLLSDREKRLCWVNDIVLVARSLDENAWVNAFAFADELGLGWALDRALDYAERHLGYERYRPRSPVAPPAWGPLRAVEELNMRASPHVGRLAVLSWRERIAYLRAVLLPTRAGLEGTVGDGDGGTFRLVRRHARQAVAGLTPPRESARRRR
jgi:putative nucleotidyltransferase-like protein